MALLPRRRARWDCRTIGAGWLLVCVPILRSGRSAIRCGWCWSLGRIAHHGSCAMACQGAPLFPFDSNFTIFDPPRLRRSVILSVDSPLKDGIDGALKLVRFVKLTSAVIHGKPAGCTPKSSVVVT